MAGGRSVDIGFCVDVSGSMKPFLPEVKSQINEISTQLQDVINTKFSNTPISLRLGFVAYRDVDEKNSILAECDLTTNTSEDSPFTRGIKELEARGGIDHAEDILGGLSAAAKWKWAGEIRFLIIITDAPGHGKELNDYSSEQDFYPDGLNGLLARDCIENLVNQQIQLLFIRCAPQETIKMQECFNRYIKEFSKDSERELVVVDLGKNLSALREAYHWIFVLDGSGSMSFNTHSPQKNNWQIVQDAVESLINPRKDDQSLDYFSTVVFSRSAKKMHDTPRPIFAREGKRTFVLDKHLGGITNYIAGLEAACDFLSNPIPNKTPVLIFMADGEQSAGCRDDAKLEQTLKTLRTLGGEEMRFFSVGFVTNEGDQFFQDVEDITQKVGGVFLPAENADKFKEQFASISSQIETSSTGVIEKVYEQIIELVTSRMATEYL